MAAHDLLDDLDLLVRSRHAIVGIEEPDGERLAAVLERFARRLDVPLFRWSRSAGLCRDGGETHQGIYGTRDLVGALGHIAAMRAPALFLLAPTEDELRDPLVVERLQDAAGVNRIGGAIVLTGSAIEIPEAVRPLSARFVLPAPTAAEYEALIARVVAQMSARGPVRVALTAAEKQAVLANLKGLTLAEAERTLMRAVMVDGLLSVTDLPLIAEAKKHVVERDGLLEYIAPPETMDDIAGLAGLKDWLAKRELLLRDPERAASYGLTFPRGVLLVGVPGCGKSLCAKAVAAAWRLPLLKLDPGALYSKWIGETEKNVRRALETAERLAPVVLWIDEIEKAFAAGGEEDGGVAQRVLGSFLSWMQERRGDVFAVATANDVSRLPPELLRKGRFDEMFFVDLPDAEARAAILRIHLECRNQPPAWFDLDRLAAATDGFSGAELEQVVVSGLYTAFARGLVLTTALLLEEIAATAPVAVTMAERIAAVRAWAHGRTVPAD